MSIPPFHEYLCRPGGSGERCGSTSSAGPTLSGTYGHQIFRGIRQPSLDKVSAGLRLPAQSGGGPAAADRRPEAAALPEAPPGCGHPHGLSHRLAITEVQELLERQGLSMLGGVGND